MTDFTFDELVLTNVVLDYANVYHAPKLHADITQGVFTQSILDEMAARFAEYPVMSGIIATLANDLAAGGQITPQPAAFTADEQTQMDFIVGHNPGRIANLVTGAEHVGFWSDIQLAKLEAAAVTPFMYHLGPHSQAAVVGLVDDLMAGGQVLHHG